MGAKPGNQFWRQRSKHGRDALFSDPEKLLQAAEEYFQWVEQNPLKEQKAFGTGIIMSMNRMRPYTLGGLCLYLGATKAWWRQFKTSKTFKENDDFSTVVTHIEQIIYTQKFEGAAAGLLNSAIIAKDLGLVDKRELTHEAGESLHDIWHPKRGRQKKK